MNEKKRKANAKRVEVAKKHGEVLQKTEIETRYFTVFGVIDFNNGSQTSGRMQCTEGEYEAVKEQILKKETIIIFSPIVTDEKGNVKKLDPMAINTDKYAYITTEVQEISVFAKSLEVAGTGLVDVKGNPISAPERKG